MMANGKPKRTEAEKRRPDNRALTPQERGYKKSLSDSEIKYPKTGDKI